MTQVKFTRPPDSACVTTPGKQTSAVSQTGITWDGSELLVSCWGDGWIDELSAGDSTTRAGTWLGRLQVTGLPGSGLGAIAWGGDRLWGCAITGSTTTKRAQSSQLGYVQFDVNGVGSWTPAGSAPHGCVNNVQVVGDQLWADGTYVGGSATSAYIDAGPAGSALVAAFSGPSIFTRTGHVSGALPNADGSAPLWEADNYKSPKSIWHMTDTGPVEVETGSLRFEQLTCDEASGTVYVKWHNQNRFGVIAGLGC